MVNTQHLEEKIRESGKTKSFLAEKIGLKSLQTFKAKCENKSEFTISQVNELCGQIGITSLSEKEKIFNSK